LKRFKRTITSGFWYF